MKKRDTRILKKINEKIFKKYEGKLFKEVKLHEDIFQFIKHYTQPDVYKGLNEEEKKKVDELVLTRDAGLLNETETITDPKIEKKFEKEIEKEIDEAIKFGVLSDPKKDSELQKYNKKMKKIWKEKETKMLGNQPKKK